MSTLTIRVETIEDVVQAIKRSVREGRAKETPGLSFVDYATMHRVLTPKRLDILRAMAGQGALSYREVARRVGRDFKGVHTDLTALLRAGVIDRQEDGVIFPYQGLHFDFDIKASAA